MDAQTAVPQASQNGVQKAIDRRNFFKLGGTAATAAFVIASCTKEDDGGNATDGINLGSGDTGILNYAYALEQLEAAFYQQVLSTPYSGITAIESEYLADIRDHEVAHREFFKAALGSNAIPDLAVNFSSINFSSRDSVLQTARTFEDLGVAAYNGAGKLLTSADFLLLAGKIVSVEARHAALIRDLISNGSFADLNSLTAFGADNAKGLDGAMMPTDVVAAATPFLRVRLNASNLPTS